VREVSFDFGLMVCSSALIVGKGSTLVASLSESVGLLGLSLEKSLVRRSLTPVVDHRPA
jgi:hypothetical protein